MLPRVLTPRSASSKGGEEGGVKFDRSCFGIVASNANYVTLGSAIQKVRSAARATPCAGAPACHLALWRRLLPVGPKTGRTRVPTACWRGLRAASAVRACASGITACDKP